MHQKMEYSQQSILGLESIEEALIQDPLLQGASVCGKSVTTEKFNQYTEHSKHTDQQTQIPTLCHGWALI